MSTSSAWELGTKPQREITLFLVAFNESLNFILCVGKITYCLGEQTLFSALVSPAEIIAITYCEV